MCFVPLQLRKAMIDTAPITAQPPHSSGPSSQAFEIYDLSFDEVCQINHSCGNKCSFLQP